MAAANDHLVTMAMIETRSALEHLDEILSVDRLDGIYVGPSDPSILLGYPPRLDGKEPEVVAALDPIVSRAREKKVFAGIHTESPAYAQKMIRKRRQTRRWVAEGRRDPRGPDPDHRQGHRLGA